MVEELAMQQQLQLLHEGSAAGHYAPQLPHQSERLDCVQTAAVERARLVRELEHLKQTKSARCQTIAPSLAPVHTHTRTCGVPRAVHGTWRNRGCPGTQVCGVQV